MRIIGWIVGLPVGLLVAGGVFLGIAAFFGPIPVEGLKYVVIPSLMVGGSVAAGTARGINRALARQLRRSRLNPLVEGGAPATPAVPEQHDVGIPQPSLEAATEAGSPFAPGQPTTPVVPSVGRMHQGVLTLTHAELAELQRDCSAYGNVIVAEAEPSALDVFGAGEREKVVLVLGTGTASAFYADGQDAAAFEPADLTFGTDDCLRIRGLSETLKVPSLWDLYSLRAWRSATPEEFMAACRPDRLWNEVPYILVLGRFLRMGHLSCLRWRLPPDSLRQAVRRLRANPRAWRKTGHLLFSRHLEQLGEQLRDLLHACDFPEAQAAAGELEQARRDKRHQSVRATSFGSGCVLLVVGSVLLAVPSLMFASGAVRQAEGGSFLVMGAVGVVMIALAIGLVVWATVRRRPRAGTHA